MSKLFGSFLFLIFVFARGVAQQGTLDSLGHTRQETDNDTLQLVRLEGLALAYQETSPDSSIYFGEKALTIARKLDLKTREAFIMGILAYAETNLGDYPRALQL
ncbi:MAG: hypothetical protein ACHQEM_11620, partial [Chitinophagales bacterium]